MKPNDYANLTLPECPGTTEARIDRLVRDMFVRGELAGSPTAVLLGQHYHLGGLAATEMMARRAAFSSDGTVLDVCCYVGAGSRYLAETAGCRVVGLDCHPNIIALARRLTELAGLQDRVSFVQEDLYRVDRLAMRFSGIWSEGSLDGSLDWLPALDHVLLPGGKLVFSLCVRMKEAPVEGQKTLDDVVSHLSRHGFRVLHVEDMREWEIEHGWKALLRQLDENQALYEDAFGAVWVRDARKRFESELGIWAREAGNAFFVAKKG